MTAFFGIWFPACVFSVGLGFFVRGMIGRRVGDEPRCRRCGYDLRGSRARPCPECREPYETHRTGVRRRFRGRLSIGLALAAVGGYGLSGKAYRSWLTGFDYFTLLPDQVLLDWARDDQNTRAADVLAERWRDGELPDDRAIELFRCLVLLEMHTRPHKWDDRTVPVETSVRMNTPEPHPARPRRKWRPSGLRGLRVDVDLDTPRLSRFPIFGNRPWPILGGTGTSLRGPCSLGDSPGVDKRFEAGARFTVVTSDGLRSVTWTARATATSTVDHTVDPWPGLERLRGNKYDEAIRQRVMELAAQLDEVGGSERRRSFASARQPDFPVLARAEIWQDGRLLGVTRTHYPPTETHPESGPRTGTLLDWKDLLSCFADCRPPALPGPADLVIRSDLNWAWSCPKYRRAWEGQVRFRIMIDEQDIWIIEPIRDEAPNAARNSKETR